MGRRQDDDRRDPDIEGEGEELVESETGQDKAGGAGDEVEDSAVASAEVVIGELHEKLSDMEDRYLRLAAEFDNFRKRTIRERSELSARAQAELAGQLLEPLDDLARVSGMGSSEHDATTILEGVRLVEKKLRRALEGFGLSPIEAVGKPFDPELHEAMVTAPTEDPEEHELVSQELARGYMFKGSLLRPALVEVKLYESEAGGSGGES